MCNDSEASSDPRTLAYNVLDELKGYIAENGNVKLGGRGHADFVIGCAQRIIDIFIASYEKNRIGEKLDNITNKIDHLINNNSRGDLVETQHKLIEKLDTINLNSSICSQQHMNYSRALKLGKVLEYPNNIKKTTTTQNVLLVYGKGEEKNSENIKKSIQNTIEPSKLRIGIEKIRKIGGGGIAIEMENMDNITILETKIKEKLPELDTRRPRKRRPHISIISVPQECNIEEIPQKIYDQNTIIQDNYERSQFEEEFKVKFNTGRKESSFKNWIVEVTPKLRKLLITSGKVNIEWSRCRIVDFCPVLQCYKCCKFGHSTKTCPEKESICSQCAGKHTYRECPLRDVQPTCCNCTKDRRMEVNHNARSSTCPIYLKLKTNLISRTNYESY
ncbi:uncharacterized protein LOC111624603 [Centruroides sculpturatus]|uniref:uncharacterized protein LOC111624603 n=1 Tax=Centruroides sculpturatus TaxID=218467 RepID=UPI000C6E67C3|nr:uncharacterized protein LOC111624603 [Centruroides sculpturatus]